VGVAADGLEVDVVLTGQHVDERTERAGHAVVRRQADWWTLVH